MPRYLRIVAVVSAEDMEEAGRSTRSLGRSSAMFLAVNSPEMGQDDAETSFPPTWLSLRNYNTTPIQYGLQFV